MADIGIVSGTLRLNDEWSGKIANISSTLKTAGVDISAFASKLAAPLVGIAAAVAGFTILVKATEKFVEVSKEAIKFAEERARVEAKVATTIRSTGMAAGVTTNQVLDLAKAHQRLTEFSDETIASGLAVLTNFTKIGQDVFPRATAAILDISAKMGKDLPASATALGRALQAPLNATRSLRAINIQLDSSQQKLIKTFIENKDIQGAQAVILAEVERRYGGQAAAAREAGLGTKSLQNAVEDLYEAFGDGLLPAVRDANRRLTELAQHGDLEDFIRGLGVTVGQTAMQALILAGSFETVLSVVSRLGSAKFDKDGVLRVPTDGKNSLIELLVMKGKEAEEAARIIRNVGDLLGQAFGKPDKAVGEVKALTEAQQGFIDKLFQQAKVLTYSQEQFAKYGAASTEAKLRIQAFTEVTSAGFDATQGLGKALATQRLVQLRANDAVDKGREAFARYMKSLESTDPLKRLVAELDRKAAAARAAMEVDAQGTLAVLKIDSEVDAEKRHTAAILGGKDALEEFNIEQEIAARLAEIPVEEWGKVRPAIEAAVRQLEKYKKVADAQVKLQESMTQIWKNFLEGLQRGFADLIYEFEKTGKISWKSLWGSFEDFAFRAIAEVIARWSAAKFVMAFSSEGGGGSGWMNLLAGYAKSRGYFGGVTSAGSGASSGLYGPTASGGNLAGGGGGPSASSVAGWAVVAAAVAAVFINRNIAKQRKQDYSFGTLADASISGGMLASGWAGKLSETGKQIAEKLNETLTTITEALRTNGSILIDQMDAIGVRIRNDKGAFKSVVDGIEHEFRTRDEAIVDAIRRGLMSSPQWASLNKYVQESIDTYNLSADAYAAGVAYVQKIVQAVSGMTDDMAKLATTAAELAQVYDNLIKAGLSKFSAATLYAQNGVQFFQNWINQVSGQSQSVAQQKKNFEASKAIMLAQALLFKIDLQTKAKDLEARIKLASLWNKFSSADLGAQFNVLKAKAKLTAAELELAKAALAAVNLAISQMDDVIRQIGGLKFRASGGGARTGLGGGGGRDSAINGTLWDLLLGDRSTLSPEKQLEISLAKFRSLKKMDDKREFAGRVLEEAQSFYGNTAMYDVIYRQVISAIGGAQYLGGNTAQDKATTSMNLLSDAATLAAMRLYRVAGVKAPTTKIAAGSTLLASTGLLSGLSGAISGATALDSSGGMTSSGGYSSDLANAVNVQGDAQVEQLLQLNTSIKKIAKATTSGGRTRSGSGGSVSDPAPPPAPTDTYSSLGGSTRIKLGGSE